MLQCALSTMISIWSVFLYSNSFHFYKHRLYPGLFLFMIGSMLLLWVEVLYMFSIKWCCTVYLCLSFCHRLLFTHFIWAWNVILHLEISEYDKIIWSQGPLTHFFPVLTSGCAKIGDSYITADTISIRFGFNYFEQLWQLWGIHICLVRLDKPARAN